MTIEEIQERLIKLEQRVNCHHLWDYNPNVTQTVPFEHCRLCGLTRWLQAYSFKV